VPESWGVMSTTLSVSILPSMVDFIARGSGLFVSQETAKPKTFVAFKVWKMSQSNHQCICACKRTLPTSGFLIPREKLDAGLEAGLALISL